MVTTLRSPGGKLVRFKLATQPVLRVYRHRARLALNNAIHFLGRAVDSLETSCTCGDFHTCNICHEHTSAKAALKNLLREVSP